MTLGSALYTLLIGPIELLFEFIFSLSTRFVTNPGFSIIFLSLAVNFLVLPLYRRADAVQAEERDLENKMKPVTDHIKRTFTGDERYMMLQTYYRQNNYKPTDTLKGSLSLLLEIPFFIAAYHFLSGLQLLKGISFGFIRDLGAPDAMFTVSGFTVNILPILMTLINVISAAIYLKGFPLKSKLQMYGMAVIFLILLYNSPSGLVFYWTLNNVFSLIKNIFSKFSNPGRILSVCFSLAGIILLVFTVINQQFQSPQKNLFLIVFSIVMQVPLLLGKFGRNHVINKMTDTGKTDDKIFSLGCIYLTILTGILIPSAVIKAAPTDFINIKAYYSPMWYILSTVLFATGTFLVWCEIFYHLASPTGKKIMAFCVGVISVCATVNYMFFGTERGDMSDQLVYDVIPTDSIQDWAVNFAVLAAISLLFCLVWKRKKSLSIGLLMTMGLAAVVMTSINISEIGKSLVIAKKNAADFNDSLPKIRLSKTGKNVVILMMDRAMGYLVPFIMEDSPVVKNSFAGFTFYPNTISYSDKTNGGLPAVYGGYEYTPEKMNERSDLLLVEKHNEALRMMPVLFDEAGYEVSVIDPTYGNYQNPSDLHIYDDHPNIHASYLRGTFVAAERLENANKSRRRNFFCYSLYKIAPLFYQPALYTEGLYNDNDAMAGKNISAVSTQTITDLETAYGIRGDFEASYSVLQNLNSVTEIIDQNVNTYTSMDNLTTHDVMMLQLPNYTLSEFVDNSKYEALPIIKKSIDGRTIELDDTDKVSSYHSNMAAYLLLSSWFDYLKEIGVWDNTRIIIVSDHGHHLDFKELKFGDSWWDYITTFIPVLFVKDFDSREQFHIDETFMTNADTPSIALEGLINSPVNPSTGKLITNNDKENPIQHIHRVASWKTNENNGYTFAPSNWVSVKTDDLFNLDSWEKIGVY